jgi:methionyl-tRNA formyltransferase
LRIIMLGTGPFAVPTLRALVASEHEVVAVVARPPRVGDGKREPPPSPMRLEAEAHGIPVLMPTSVNTDPSRAELAALQPDLLVVCDYGEILAPETLAVASLGGVNLHGSLLPKYRGAAPVQWAILRGETETGDTVIQMTPGLDAGPALAVYRTPIGPNENAAELEARLAEAGGPLVLAVVRDLAIGQTHPVAQDASQATRARRLRKSDGLIDWSKPASHIHRQVRALQPWPATFTSWPRTGKEPLRLIVHEVLPQPDVGAPLPGTLVRITPRPIVAAGEGSIELVRVQSAGKQPMAVEDFLRGYPARVGEKLG